MTLSVLQHYYTLSWSCLKNQNFHRFKIRFRGEYSLSKKSRNWCWIPSAHGCSRSLKPKSLCQVLRNLDIKIQPLSYELLKCKYVNEKSKRALGVRIGAYTVQVAARMITPIANISRTNCAFFTIGDKRQPDRQPQQVYSTSHRVLRKGRGHRGGGYRRFRLLH